MCRLESRCISNNVDRLRDAGNRDEMLRCRSGDVGATGEGKCGRTFIAKCGRDTKKRDTVTVTDVNQNVYRIPVKSTDLVGSLPILNMSTDLPIGFSI